MMRAGYKNTDFGETPVDWEVDNLETLAERFSGHTPDKKVETYWNGTIPWISLKDTKRLDKRYIELTKDYTTKKGIDNSSSVILPKGTVILSRDATVGKVGIIKTEMATSQHFINYVCGDKLNNLYLYYDFYYRKPMFERMGIGSTIKTIGLPFFKSLKILLPPINEQQKIATILSSVDEHIDEVDGMIEDLKKLKKGLMQKLLTVGIGHTKFKDSAVGRIPVEWEVAQLGNFCLKITKGTTPTTIGYDFVDKGINFVKVESITNMGKIIKDKFMKITQECHQKMLRSQIQTDDLLVSIAGTIGRSAIIKTNYLPANTNQALAIIRVNKQKLIEEYLHYLFSSEYLKRYTRKVSTVGAQPNMSLDQISKFIIPLPSLEEQKKIVTKLSYMDLIIVQYENELTDLQTLKKGLMQQLLTGKTRVKIDN